MASREEDKILSHNYDGIQEYDNSLPLWWQYLFLISMVFALVYMVYYHFGPGLSQEEVLAGEMREAQEREVRLAAAKKAAEPADEASVLLALTTQPEVVAKGKEIFLGKCVPCHGQFGQGIVGPNLTDDYWLHGGKITDIKNTVTNGVLEKGMLAWKTMLNEGEINAVVSYVWSLHGTNPPSPKAPEGKLEPRQ